MGDVTLPYFDYLLAQLAKGNRAVEQSLGRNVHWGYWEHPNAAQPDDEDFARAAEQLTLELLALASMRDGQRILDVGCGFGGTIATLNDHYKQLRLCGLNIDPRQLDRARRIVSARTENTVDFVEGDACDLPFPDISFDRVLAVECVFHFPSRERFFEEAHRVLQPRGLLVLSDFVPSPLLRAFAPLRPKRPGRAGAFGAVDVSYTLENYRTLARDTGFVLERGRDITAHTLPTYGHIRRIVGAKPGSLFAALLGLQKLLSAFGLLRYHLLAFRKP